MNSGTTDQAPQAGIPRLLAANAAKSTAKRLDFYSNGVITVLAPKGWACTSLFAADGSRNLAAYPPGQVDPTSASATPKAQGVIGILDYTGHGPGVELVCGLFPNATAVKTFGSLPGSTCTPSPNETVARPTPDVAVFHDPPNIKGSGDLAGGPNPNDGVILFPQDNPGSDNVSKETCALSPRQSDLCAAIVSDFVVRAFPSEVSATGP